jgi:LytS/YehU family sensor histidine kinase
VENAVKHNPESDDYLPYVRIFFRLSEGKLHFVCVNSKPTDVQETDENKGGIGLVNVQRRLSLLYPNEHLLNIESGTNQFQVDLQIPYS